MANQLPAPPPIDYGALNKLLAAAPNTAGLAKQAAGQAAADTNAVTASLRGQQAAEMQRAQQTAAALLGAAQAASGQLAGMDLGGHQADALRQAALDQAGLASGFSGQLRDTATDQSNTLLRALDALHAPGGAPNTGEQAGNVVYGVGKLPADAMLAAAPFAEAQARALPAQLLAHGQEEATGALGAGAQRAHELDPQIADALAKQPALARQYLGDLQKAAADAREASIGNMFKALTLQQHGYEQESLRFYRQAQLDQHESDQAASQALKVQALNANNKYRYDALNQRGAIADANLKAKNVKDNTPIYDAARSNSLGYAVDQFGNPLRNKNGSLHLLPGYRVNPKTGAVEKIGSGGKGGGPGGASKTQVQKWRGEANTIGQQGVKGYWANQFNENVPVKASDITSAVADAKRQSLTDPNLKAQITYKNGKRAGKYLPDDKIAQVLGFGYFTLSPDEAYAQMIAAGVPDNIARNAVLRYYPPPKPPKPLVVPPAGVQGPRLGGGPVGIRG